LRFFREVATSPAVPKMRKATGGLG
jgi:hypothetical protein